MKVISWLFGGLFWIVKNILLLLLALILIFVGCIGYVFMKTSKRENEESEDPDPIVEKALEEDLNKLPRGDFRDLLPLQQCDACFSMFESLKGNCMPRVRIEHWWEQRKRKHG